MNKENYKKKFLPRVFFQVTVRTAPGAATFTATLRLDGGGGHVGSSISRTNLYGDTSHCVVPKLTHLREYCFCKDML